MNNDEQLIQEFEQRHAQGTLTADDFRRAEQFLEEWEAQDGARLIDEVMREAPDVRHTLAEMRRAISQRIMQLELNKV